MAAFLLYLQPKHTRARCGHAAGSGPENCAFCFIRIRLSGIPSASTPSPPFPVHSDLAMPCTGKEKPPEIPGGVKTKLQLTKGAVSTSWLSFGTARRRDPSPSHFERGLKPARPGLSLGVFRRFGTMASLRAVASPNEVNLSATLYYCINNASRGKQNKITA
jgi:hypothetical protein